RATLTIPESDGLVHRLTHDLSERGAEIVALGTFWGDDAASREITFKARGIGRETLEAVARDLGAHIVDARET
ncbi:MAG: hypothetical protein JXA74_17810, partial [Anaerolineae bacterium]|nr:hypothetical protein [Anaerolineae bacterium]